jgi:hypothetical protein
MVPGVGGASDSPVVRIPVGLYPQLYRGEPPMCLGRLRRVHAYASRADHLARQPRLNVPDYVVTPFKAQVH